MVNRSEQIEHRRRPSRHRPALEQIANPTTWSKSAKIPTDRTHYPERLKREEQEEETRRLPGPSATMDEQEGRKIQQPIRKTSPKHFQPNYGQSSNE